ncbi:DUF2061 domain-containing protein [Altericroceibacterium endophyticum]|uniref:DUF2061 domain-containing protein n=1 Tax=Altericroceibacterium endophyticum TaxID=1808508 RepID=A0A6I4T7P2_9SPHN|nr:DUF2061 domain-containing protein [Altericroceibacterium endophyticum]MXO66976.1 DUF2061 domain-containing protein [Altericroceibacterium endophyticum]
MPQDLIKTFTYLVLHLMVGFSVAYAITGSLALAGGIALIEPCINAVAFFFHEKAWAGFNARSQGRNGAKALHPSLLHCA